MSRVRERELRSALELQGFSPLFSHRRCFYSIKIRKNVFGRPFFGLFFVRFQREICRGPAPRTPRPRREPGGQAKKMPDLRSLGFSVSLRQGAFAAYPPSLRSVRYSTIPLTSFPLPWVPIGGAEKKEKPSESFLGAFPMFTLRKHRETSQRSNSGSWERFCGRGLSLDPAIVR
jgi:hypothetical protein